MGRQIVIHSFGDFDRSGKVRWTAEELGYEITEQRLKAGEHISEAYRSLNPYAQIPTVEMDGNVLIESSAICLVLAERHVDSDLVPTALPDRNRFWQVMGVATTTLEQLTVNYFVSKNGIIEPEWVGLIEKPLGRRLRVFANSVPVSGYWLGSFSLADIFAAYPLRLAVSAGLLPFDGRLADYIGRLRQRPAAIRARFFDSLDA